MAKSQLNTNDEYDAKLVLLGDTGVGKTSLAVRYVQESFTTRLQPTIGASFLTKRVVIDNCKIKLQIWDTAGQERFRSLAPMYYRGACAAILAFDITSEISFVKVKDWVLELKANVQEDIILCIVGNKIDLETSRKITTEQGEQYAQSIGAQYYEASARLNQGIDTMFTDVAKKLKVIYIKNPPKNTNSPLYQVIHANDTQSDTKPAVSTNEKKCCG